jgi:hypothetical protein
MQSRTITHSPEEIIDFIQKGQQTIGQIKGVGDAEIEAGIQVAREMMGTDQMDAAGDVLAGLMLYDPYKSETWKAIEELCVCKRLPQQAQIFREIANALEE